jgi:hypothetical protein
VRETPLLFYSSDQHYGSLLVLLDLNSCALLFNIQSSTIFFFSNEMIFIISFGRPREITNGYGFSILGLLIENI